MPEKVQNYCDRRRKYTVNEKAFDVVTDESAYWTGFIMADGCISYDRRGQNYAPRLRINLKTCDIGHLEKLRDFLKYNGIIALRDNDRYCSLEITSGYLVDSLKRFGITERKSRSTKIVGLNNNLHFWRGVIDGDGCLYRNKEGYRVLFLCGSEPLMNQYADYLVEQNLVRRRPSVRNIKIIKQVTVNGKEAAAAVYHFYANARVSLERKQAIANNWRQ